MSLVASRYFFPRLAMSALLAHDVDAHRARRPRDAVHRGLDGARGHVRHLRLRDLLELLAGELAYLLLARLVRSGALLLLRVQPERFLDEDGRGWRLDDEGKGAVRVDGDEDRDDEALLRLRLRGGVELLAEAHDVDAVLAEGRPDGWRRIRLPRGKLQLDHSGYFLRHLFLSVWCKRPCERPPTVPLRLLDLHEIELHRRRATEDGDEHPHAPLVRIHFLDRAVEVGERAVDHPHVVSFLEFHLRLGLERSLGKLGGQPGDLVL